MRCPQCGKFGAAPETCNVDIRPGTTAIFCGACRIRTYVPNEILKDYMEPTMPKKEDPAMKVSYKGFTGELVKLERYKPNTPALLATISPETFYNLEIYDTEKAVTHSFTHVKLEGVRFLGGAVTFTD